MQRSRLYSGSESTDAIRPGPDQLKNPDSFASKLKKMLAARKQYKIDQGTMNAVPPRATKRLPFSK